MSAWEYFTRGDYAVAIQVLQTEEPDLSNQKQKSLEANYSFADLDEYICTLLFAAKVEEALSDRNKNHHFNSVIRILDLFPGENGFMGSLNTPKKYCSDIQTGDKAILHFRVEKQLDRTTWNLTFIEALPGLPPGFMTVTGRKFPEKNTDEMRQQVLLDNDTDEETRYQPQAVSWPKHTPSSKKISHIAKTAGTKCTVDILSRQSIFPCVFQAGGVLHTLDSSIKQILIDPRGGIESDSISRLDIYSTLQNPECASPSKLCLNQSQRDVIEQARRAPGGFVIAHGGPGTGKTQ